MGMCNVDQIFELNYNALLVGSMADYTFCSGNLLNHIAEI